MKHPIRIRQILLFIGLLLPQLVPAQIAIETNDQPMTQGRTPRPGPPPVFYEVKQISVNAFIRDQVAETQVSQTLYNPSGRVMEAELFFPLPEGGAVQQFTLLVDGQELPGRLLPKDEARQIYEEIVRRKNDPALMEYVGYGLFKTSIFPIPPGASRTITIKFTQLCEKRNGIVQYAYPFGTQKFSGGAVGKLTFRARIQTTEPLKTIYSPTDQVRVERPDNREAIVSFEEERVRREKDFKLSFSAENGEVGASILSFRPDNTQDGYFMLLASPEVKADNARRIIPKTVIFVLDRSGSMEGKKLEQAKEALKFVLNNLRDGDLFNIVDYDDDVRTWKPELMRYNSNTRREALRYTEAIESGGGTNIYNALEAAMRQVQNDERPNYVLFLTDGLPTAGNTNEMAISENATRLNKHKTRLFAFGVGEDVNARLLDRLVSGNGGRSEYVSLEDNLEAKIAAFYAGINAPVLSNLKIEVDGTDVNRAYPQSLPDMFEGGQLVWVGRYNKSGRVTIKMTGKIGDEARKFTFNASLANESDGSTHSYVEKIWATRRIGYLIDQIDLNGRKDEWVQELVSLSKKHGILTPYTSFLADENVDFRDDRANIGRAGESLKDLQEVSGGYANAQRSAKQTMMNAASPAAAPPPPAMRPEAEAKPDAQTIRQLGTKTFFLRNGVWIEADITPAEEVKAQVVKQLSDAYFTLARSQTAEFNQYLNMERAVILRIGNAVYRIDP